MAAGAVDASLVILAHNGCFFTRHCLTSILAADVRPVELLLVDNGSTDETPELVAEFAPRVEAAGVRFLTWRNAENKGCSVARNEAWERATGKYVVFQDNDTAVCSRRWLAALAGALEADPEIGVIGPKLIYPFLPHRIQCAGVDITASARVHFRGRGLPREHPDHQQERDVTALISACWMMPRTLYDAIGGLDPLFHPVQYEDLDFCFRVVESGRRCVYTPAVEMYHFEGMTTGALGKDNYVRTIAANSGKFRRKWRHVIKTLPPDTGEYHWAQRHELGLGEALDLSLV